jgi:hypothetical protein
MTVWRRQGHPEHACVPVYKVPLSRRTVSPTHYPVFIFPSKLAVSFTCHVSVASLQFSRYHLSRVKPACRCEPCPNATCQAGVSVCAMSQCHVSDWPIGVGHVPVPRVRLAYRCGSCPSATCQAGLSVRAMSQCDVSDSLSVWAMSKCHVSGRPAGVGHVPVPRVRVACRCGPCPSATCQVGLSVWAMSLCHVSGRPAGVGHVPVPRVKLACRCGPCPTATCQVGLSVWAMSQ